MTDTDRTFGRADRLAGEILARLDSIDRSLDHLHTHLADLLRKQDELMATVTQLKAKLATLTAKVAALTDIDQSIVTLVSGLAALIASLRQQLADALAAGADPAAIQDVIDGLAAIETTIDDEAAKIAAAVVAGTETPVDPDA